MKVAPRMHTQLLTMVAPAHGSGVDVRDEGWLWFALSICIMLKSFQIKRHLCIMCLMNKVIKAERNVNDDNTAVVNQQASPTLGVQLDF